VSTFTEIFFSAPLNLPPKASTVLKFMMSPHTQVMPALPEHEFFQCENWHALFLNDSYAFVPRNIRVFEFDKPGNIWVLIVRACVNERSNRDQMIEKFFDWIKPYAASKGMIGYMREEEAAVPTRIWSAAGE
jgi:hypothetical protein